MHTRERKLFFSVPVPVICLLTVGVWFHTAEGESKKPEVGVVTSPNTAKTSGPQDLGGEVTEAHTREAEAKKPEGIGKGIELPKEAELRSRVQARWDAVINRKFDKAYAFETPEYRREHSVEEYGRQFGGWVRWHVASIKELRYHRPNEVDVIIQLDYSLELPGSDQMMRTQGDFGESWVFQQDQWWRNQPRQPLRGTPQSQRSLKQ